MYNIPLITNPSFSSVETFWDLVFLYHNKPHVINRKLLAISQALFCKVEFNSKDIKHVSELLTKSSILYETRKLKSLSKACITEDFLKNMLDSHDKNVRLYPTCEKEFRAAHHGVFVSVRILFPRIKIGKVCLEVVVLDKNENSVIFIAVTELNETPCAPPFPYEFQLTSTSDFRINVINFEDADTPHAEWLSCRLFPKLLKWSKSNRSNCIDSLSSIEIEDYYTTYRDVRDKYSEDLIKQWFEKTKTDPQKYVFEDLAIASYLICLWRKLDLDDISFVDCGCGNGLLVYVLNQEGFEGYGIDIRRRCVWDIYPKETKLEVGAVTPTTTFPSSTWIIGNHSDELTPWIPVIALKSSPKTNYFVLPCCAYDFSGQKYIRVNTSISVYSDYLNYIHKISESCGFDTTIDKLRIPSTKRVCLLGIRNNLAEDDRNNIIQEVSGWIESKVAGFAVRCSEEKVRNCTQLKQDLVQRIISKAVDCLLSEANLVEKSNGEKWNVGSELSLSDLSKLVPVSDLKELKKECKGLQTLLRNHRYIFEVTKGGVKLRIPPRRCEESKYMDKPCWFLKNHPDGCLHSSVECAYRHEN